MMSPVNSCFHEGQLVCFRNWSKLWSNHELENTGHMTCSLTQHYPARFRVWLKSQLIQRILTVVKLVWRSVPLFWNPPECTWSKKTAERQSRLTITYHHWPYSHKPLHYRVSLQVAPFSPSQNQWHAVHFSPVPVPADQFPGTGRPSPLASSQSWSAPEFKEKHSEAKCLIHFKPQISINRMLFQLQMTDFPNREVWHLSFGSRKTRYIFNSIRLHGTEDRRSAATPWIMKPGTILENVENLQKNRDQVWKCKSRNSAVWKESVLLLRSELKIKLYLKQKWSLCRRTYYWILIIHAFTRE